MAKRENQPSSTFSSTLINQKIRAEFPKKHEMQRFYFKGVALQPKYGGQYSLGGQRRSFGGRF
jgi:hypothetical protein